jgi:fructose-1,6-bisphosphatase I
MAAADARETLSKHLARTVVPAAGGIGIAAIIEAIARVSMAIAQELAHAALRDRLGTVGDTNATGDQVKKLDVWGHETMAAALAETAACSAFVSEEAKDPVEFSRTGRAAEGFVVCCDPVDGSSNLDVNGTVGTIFALFPSGGRVPAGPAALVAGSAQAAAGYVMYGPSTALVYTAGHGTHAFTLDHASGEYQLTNPDIRVPSRGKVYGINEGNFHSWHAGQRAFVEYLRTPDRPSGRPYSLRYSGAMVADVHRTLLAGGLFMYPADHSDPARPKSKLRLLYEVAPMAMLTEQAGGRASTGTGRILDLQAKEYHQRAAVILGSADDVAKAEEFYRSRGA